MRVFVSGTGTGIGKTYVSRALALALRSRGEEVTAIKPLETGCEPEPLDAIALADACGRPELARWPGLYRVAPPLAPWAATLAGQAPLDFDALVRTLEPFLTKPNLIVEGAGGVLVPLDATRYIADLAGALHLPIALVARDGLGVLSHTLSAAESVIHRGLVLSCVILRENPSADLSTDSNLDILSARIDAPVLRFPYVNSESELADAGRAILSRMPPSR